MGSWDACCGISKLPIRPGDPVVDFYIGEVVRFSDRGFICYSNNLWSPLTIQTYGEYADYGEIKAEYGWHTDYVTQILRKFVIELELGENEYHDIVVKRDKVDYDFAQNAIHEGRLYVDSPKWAQRKDPIGMPVNRMMVHRFVFDAMVSWGIDNWRCKADLASIVKEGLDSVADMKKDSLGYSDETLRYFLIHRASENLFISSFRDSESGDLYTPHKFGSYFDFLHDNRNSPNVSDIITELAKFIIFRARFSEMQFLWTPQIGSQEQPYDTLSKLYRLCDNYVQDRLKENDDEYDDNDDNK